VNLIKQPIAILLLLIFFSGIGIKSIVTFHYFFNKAEIIELFCVNKEKPQLQCKGKCHLAQELKEVEQENEAQPYLPVQTNLNVELIFILEDINIKLHATNSLIKKHTPYLIETPTDQFFSIVTPPPQQIA